MKFSEKAEEQRTSASCTTNFMKVLYPDCEEKPQFTDLLPLNKDL